MIMIWTSTPFKMMLLLMIGINEHFKELGFPQHELTRIYMDNLPFVKSVVGEKGASIKSKHIMIRLSIINKAYVNGDIDLKHMSTQHIPSDMLSKLVLVTTHWHLKKQVL